MWNVIVQNFIKFTSLGPTPHPFTEGVKFGVEERI